MKQFLVIIFTLLTTLAKASSDELFDGYTDKQSYKVGETVHFFLNTEQHGSLWLFFNGGPAQFFITNVNSNTIDVLNSPNQSQVINYVNPWENGYGYANNLDWVIPSNLKSGIYRLTDAINHTHDISFILSNGNSMNDIVVVLPTNTDIAYNDVGGHSLYDTIIPRGSYMPYLPGHFNTYPKMSILRPGRGEADIYEPFVRWIISNGNFSNNSINFISDLDAEDYSNLVNAKLLIFPGHSEYWTRKEKDNYDQFVDNGGNALFLSGNTMWWNVRFENNNTQMVCYRDADIDPECDPILKTTNWSEIKSSTYASIGTYWGDNSLYGAQGSQPDGVCGYSGFNGLKITEANSPLFSGLGFNNGDIIQIATGEYDGSLMSNVDGNNNNFVLGGGYPTLDVTSLGFYKAEMIAYDQSDYTGSYHPLHYAPMIVFQKTFNSGKVINANSNMWCSQWGIGGVTYTNNNCSSVPIAPDSRIPQIVENMILLLLNNSNVWTNPTLPGCYTIKPPPIIGNGPAGKDIYQQGSPKPTCVSYSACVTDGVIDIKPEGVYLTNGFKIDNNDGTFSAKIESCVTCNHSSARTGATTTNTKPNSSVQPIAFSSGSMVVAPNPFNSSTTLQINLTQSYNLSIILYNAMGQPVQIIQAMHPIEAGNHQYNINRNNLPAGMYLLEIKTDNETIHKQIIIQ